MRTYRLPDGDSTISHEEYTGAWMKLAKPIERATGSKVYGFDPDLAFMCVGSQHYFHLPVWVAQKLHDALTQK